MEQNSAPMDKLVKSPPLQGGNYGFEPRWEYKNLKKTTIKKSSIKKTFIFYILVHEHTNNQIINMVRYPYQYWW